jgi:pimeloyl-ACP methyl ester carboxylesterase
MTRTISLAGTTLELIERGQGRSLLFLHAGEGLAPERPWLDLLAKRYCVIAPSHPGYGNSPLIDGGAGGVDDLGPAKSDEDLFMPCTVAAGNQAMWRAGIDLETYARVDGAWMFRHKRSEPLMSVRFETGWAQTRFA